MKVSIITPTFNSDETIEYTIKSILSQSYKNIEHIIIDKESSDKTLSIISKYKKEYNGRLIVVSEKDDGLFDAMNKGIKMASGEIIGILNSDDVLSGPNIIKTIVDTFKADKSDIVFGDLLYIEKNLQMRNRVWKSKIGNIKKGWIPPHPTLYLKPKVYKKIGYFNLKYRRTSDLDLMIRIFSKKTFKSSYIPKVLVLMRVGGESSDGIKGYYENFKESYRIYRDNGFKFSLIISVGRIIKTIFQMFKAKILNIKNKGISN